MSTGLRSTAVRRSGRGGTGVKACDQHVHLAAELQSRRHGVQRGALDVIVVVFGYHQCGHGQITFDSFLSLATSVATSGTLMPALRLGGSTSTPRSAGLNTSSVFFFAFMMLGNVT